VPQHALGGQSRQLIAGDRFAPGAVAGGALRWFTTPSLAIEMDPGTEGGIRRSGCGWTLSCNNDSTVDAAKAGVGEQDGSRSERVRAWREEPDGPSATGSRQIGTARCVSELACSRGEGEFADAARTETVPEHALPGRHWCLRTDRRVREAFTVVIVASAGAMCDDQTGGFHLGSPHGRRQHASEATTIAGRAGQVVGIHAARPTTQEIPRLIIIGFQYDGSEGFSKAQASALGIKGSTTRWIDRFERSESFADERTNPISADHDHPTPTPGEDATCGNAKSKWPAGTRTADSKAWAAECVRDLLRQPSGPASSGRLSLTQIRTPAFEISFGGGQDNQIWGFACKGQSSAFHSQRRQITSEQARISLPHVQGMQGGFEVTMGAAKGDTRNAGHPGRVQTTAWAASCPWLDCGPVAFSRRHGTR
jgi:hypothetical protein